MASKPMSPANVADTCGVVPSTLIAPAEAGEAAGHAPSR